MNNEFGILYFCDQNPTYQRMLQMSLASLKRFHPDWPVEIVQVASPPTPLWKKLYRLGSFWRWTKRRARAGQDVRVIAAKANIMLNSPFQHTLYLDVDSYVMRPLGNIRDMLMSADVVITPLPWKSYIRNADWQPERWPYMMAGIMGFNKHFVKVYSEYVSYFDDSIEKLPSQEQYIVSLCCEMEAQNLKIMKSPHLQIDALNIEQHLGVNHFPMVNGCINLLWNGIKDFYIFHYNEHKPQYMQQIQNLLFLPSDFKDANINPDSLIQHL